VRCIYIKKAFDSGNHSIMLHKFEHNGMGKTRLS